MVAVSEEAFLAQMHKQTPDHLVVALEDLSEASLVRMVSYFNVYKIHLRIMLFCLSFAANAGANSFGFGK